MLAVCHENTQTKKSVTNWLSYIRLRRSMGPSIHDIYVYIDREYISSVEKHFFPRNCLSIDRLIDSYKSLLFSDQDLFNLFSLSLSLSFTHTHTHTQTYSIQLWQTAMQFTGASRVHSVLLQRKPDQNIWSTETYG